MRTHVIINSLRLALLSCSVATDVIATGSGSGFEENMRTANGFASYESNTLTVQDFDGDGLPELAIPTENSGTAIVSIVGYTEGKGWNTKQVLILPSAGLPSASDTVVAAGKQGDEAYLAVATSYRTLIYSGWPLQLSRSDASGKEAIAVGDLEGNGTLEIISTYPSPIDSRIFISDITTGNVLWTFPGSDSHTRRLTVAQLDDDPALEIVLSHAPGIIIDGVTREIEYSHGSGFGTVISVSEPSSPVPGFVTNMNQGVTRFASSPWGEQWNVFTEGATSTVAMVDVDNDDVDEVAFWNRWKRSIEIVDSNGVALSLQIEAIGLNMMSAADFDGDGGEELALVLGQGVHPDIQTSVIEVVDPDTGTQEFLLPAMRAGPYIATFSGADNAPNLVQVSVDARPNANQKPGLLRQFDIDQQSEIWHSPIFGPDDPLADVEVWGLHSVQLEGDADDTLIVVGTRDRSKIFATGLDPNTGAVRWHQDLGSSETFTTKVPSALFDRNGDGLVESLFICNLGHIQERSLPDGALLWEMQPNQACDDVLIVPHGGRRHVLVAGHYGIKAYDTETRNETWHVDENVEEAAIIPNGVDGLEVVASIGESLRFYNFGDDMWSRYVYVGMYFSAVAQPEGASIHELLIANGDELKVLDGVTGRSRVVAKDLGILRPPMDVRPLGNRKHRVAVGSSVGAFAFTLDLAAYEHVFADGFN